MTAPELFLLALAAYALTGFVFALVFVTLGVPRLDPTARGTSWAFRVFIVPGSIVLWPLLATKWARHRGEPT
ncbi:MAG: hypothetical protein J0I06_05400 [Planctomycetes bacterium]|nr:hypothetical protein [Planctomycetota bacterium]